jgi:hypothetical protein
MRRALVAALWFIALPPTRADVRILASPGGEVGTYLGCDQHDRSRYEISRRAPAPRKRRAVRLIDTGKEG